MPKAARIVLGPQLLEKSKTEIELRQQNLTRAVGSVAKNEAIALLAAGWEEREAEDGWLREVLGVEVINLELFRRGEELFDQDNELFSVMEEQQRRLRELKRLHRLRLDHVLAAFRQLQREAPGRSDPGGRLLAGERESALEAVRALDRHHLTVVERMRESVDAQWLAHGRQALDQKRSEIDDVLARCSTVLVAGGNVEVLLDHLRLFDLGSRLATRHIVAWSAGAMALSARVLLFHDHPPWGAGNAELLDRGLDLFPDLLMLPHARRRLRLQDRERVGALAQRVAPLMPVVLDGQAFLELRADGWWGSHTARLEEDGSLSAFGSASERMSRS